MTKKTGRLGGPASIGETSFDILNVAGMLMLCLITLYPFWYVLVLSLNDGADAAKGPIWFWPREFTFVNYLYVFQNPYITNSFVISILRSVVGSVSLVAVILLAAYSLSKKYLPLRKYILYFLLIPMFVGGSVIANYVVIVKLGLMNNFLVYILPSAFSFFFMIIVRTFIEQLPEGLDESARIDGAGDLHIFLRIVIPLSKPIIAAMLFFGIVGHWLEFGTNLFYITDRSLYVVQYVLYMVVLSNQSGDMLALMQATGKVPTNVGQTLPTPQVLKMSTLITITLPLLFIYPFFQKYFIKGLMVGAIKA